MKKVITILNYVPKLLVIICYIIVACIFISIGKHIVVKQYKKSNEKIENDSLIQERGMLIYKYSILSLSSKNKGKFSLKDADSVYKQEIKKY